MKIKRQNHSVLFRGFVLVLAFALTAICFPVKDFTALAASLSEYTDYSFMTIGKVSEEFTTSVSKGATYQIPNAYIGGKNTFVVGKVADDTTLAEHVTLKSSKVVVNYSTLTLDEINSDQVAETTDITNKVVVTREADNYGHFVADKIGTYTITYSYTYEISGKTYVNQYSLSVESEMTNASMNFDSNTENFIPSVIDLNLVKDGQGTSGNLYLPTPTVLDEDGEEVENVKFATSKDVEGFDNGDYVVITATGGINASTVTISKDERGYYISKSVFEQADYGADKYTIRYAYYHNGNFVTATTKSTQVYAKDVEGQKSNKYYTDYKLQLELASDWTDNGQTGVESKLPSAKGVTSKDSTPASETVDVFYTVKAYYKAKNSDKSYTEISKDEYNLDLDGNGVVEGEEIIVDNNGNLTNPTKFKPLKDGWYTFVYTITDFYGNTVSSSKGVYEFADIKDEKDPTPVVYDASVTDADKKYEDASSKLATRSNLNSVVVYAIGIDDNVSKVGDEGVELTRKIMTSDTVTKMTIKDYDEFNLVFNYRDSSTIKAYENLKTNNYLIRKQTTEISTDTQMLTWLKDHGYRVVVDNANVEIIYNIFNAENYFDEIEAVKSAVEAETDEAKKADVKKSASIAWLKSTNSTASGFAYIDVDQTFGASINDNGMGSGQYYIHYIAKDAAGNETDVSKSMYVGSYVDNDSPTIKFSTTLSDSYLPTSKITFNVPTATDNYDNNMIVRTMYRFLDKNGKPIAINDDANNNLTELWTDISTVREDGKLLTEKYVDYHFKSTDENKNDYYIELTDKAASNYTIDLSEGGENAVSMQIVAFVYDDNGNASLYGETIGISKATDTTPPQFKSLSADNNNFEYDQGAEIELPSLLVYDDAVSYMSFDVNVYYVKDGTRTKVATYDYSADREVLSSTGAGKFTVNAGKFMASFAGEYEASIAVKDSKNQTVVAFVKYKVNPRTIIQPPVINTSLESKTIELDGGSNYDPKTGIEIPTPSVSYQIANSVTYDEFIKDTSAYADKDFVVIGANVNGKATNWSTTYGQQGSFKPSQVGTYPIQYTVNLTVYNHKTFTYQEMKWDEGSQSYDEGGYFTFTNRYGKTAQVVLNKNGEFEVEDSEGYAYIIVKENDVIKILNPDNMLPTTVDSGSALEGVDVKSWFSDLRNYTLKSDVYTITVQDKVGPTISEYDYVNTISTEEVSATDGYKLKIYGIEAKDASGINASKSKVVLSWKLANGDTGSKTYEGLMSDEEYTISASAGKVLDGTYKVTYTVYDNQNNYSTKEYTIAVGDNVAPTISVKDDFVGDSYEIGTELKIDTSKIDFTDNRDFQENVKPVITLKNTSTDKEIELDDVAGIKTCKLEEVGSYTLTIEVEDAVGNKTTKNYTFEVTAKKNDTTNTYKVVGTILIVISVLVLVGVIVYFVVSKVKLDKELKK